MLTERIPRYSPATKPEKRVRALDERVQPLGRGLVRDVDPDRDLAAVVHRPVLDRARLHVEELVELVAGPVLQRDAAASPARSRPETPAASQPRCCSGFEDQASTWRPWAAVWRSSTSLATSQPLASSWSTTARAMSLERSRRAAVGACTEFGSLGSDLVVQVRLEQGLLDHVVLRDQLPVDRRPGPRPRSAPGARSGRSRSPRRPARRSSPSTSAPRAPRWPGSSGDMARLRHSWLGSVQPQRVARSPVTSGTAPGGQHQARRCRSSGRGRTGRSAMFITPALSSIPDPARISELFAASTRYFDGPCAICAMPFDASSTSIIDWRTLPSWRANLRAGVPQRAEQRLARPEVDAAQLAARLGRDRRRARARARPGRARRSSAV